MRKELHLFGALKIEPDLLSIKSTFEAALVDEKLVELWRLAGGLKPEIQGFITDLSNSDMAYEKLVGSVQVRLEFMASGFPLRAVLTERGRASFIDKMRNQVMNVMYDKKMKENDNFNGNLKNDEIVMIMRQF
jgi:hypothetical protein